MIDYKGKVALVTGAASGIGKALALELAERRAHVVCADVNETGAKETAREIGKAGQAIACDLADPTAAARLVGQAHALKGRLDLVCSNAGIGYRNRLVEQEMDGDERLEALFQINFFAGLKIAQAYLRLLERTGARGHLMVTASENSLSLPSAVRGSAMGFYGATKHGLLIAMEWLRDEVADGPLDLHVLMPGAVYTPLIARVLPDPALAPPELELISAERCAELAIKGMDLGLFYIPTQGHLLEDMRPRMQGVAASLKALGVVSGELDDDGLDFVSDGIGDGA